MKKILFLSLISVFSLKGQIKVYSGGNTVVGSLSTTGISSKLQIVGNSTFLGSISTITSAAHIRGNNNYSTIANPDYTFYGNDQTGIFHPAANVLGFGVGNSETFRINSTGNILVGNTFDNNTCKLQVTGHAIFRTGASPQSAAFIRANNVFSDATTPDYTFWGNDQTGIFHPNLNILAFTVGGLEAMRMILSPTYGRQVAIGTSPYLGYAFTVYGSSWAANSGTWSGSDKRYKNNIQHIDNALEKVLKINGFNYEYRKEEFKDKGFESGKHYGFIAQELKEVLPQVVKEEADGFYSVNYIQVIPVLVEAIKEQNSKIEQLKQEVEALKSANNELTNTANNSTSVSNNKLYQNIPNPFNAKTSIKFNVDKKATTAVIVIYNLKGDVVKKYDLKNSTAIPNTIEINANELEPGAYLYSLVVENTVIETRTMILTK